MFLLVNAAHEVFRPPKAPENGRSDSVSSRQMRRIPAGQTGPDDALEDVYQCLGELHCPSIASILVIARGTCQSSFQREDDLCH